MWCFTSETWRKGIQILESPSLASLCHSCGLKNVVLRAVEASWAVTLRVHVRKFRGFLLKVNNEGTLTEESCEVLHPTLCLFVLLTYSGQCQLLKKSVSHFSAQQFNKGQKHPKFKKRIRSFWLLAKQPPISRWNSHSAGCMYVLPGNSSFLQLYHLQVFSCVFLQ